VYEKHQQFNTYKNKGAVKTVISNNTSFARLRAASANQNYLKNKENFRQGERSAIIYTL